LLNLDMGREDQDANVRKFFPNSPRRFQAFSAMGWRHPDIDDGQIGLTFANQGHEFGAVSRLANDLEAGPLEQAGKTLTEQHIIIGDDESDPPTVHPWVAPT
jgi:hypothetical protein